MGTRLIRLALKHKRTVTLIAVAGLLVNLVIVGSADPPSDLVDRDLPLAASCQGGGAGCAEQPLIPPPALGLPHFDPPPPVVYGGLVLVEATPSPDLTSLPPRTLLPPPLSRSIA